MYPRRNERNNRESLYTKNIGKSNVTHLVISERIRWIQNGRPSFDEHNLI